jgi:sulfite reductase (NADPH) hemoprotein beta-component
MIPMSQLVIANRLNDGLVVFLTENGDWSESIVAASIAADNTQGERLMEIATQAKAGCHVIDPYLIEITEGTGGHIPVSFREAIRVAGPTVQTELNQKDG